MNRGKVGKKRQSAAARRSVLGTPCESGFEHCYGLHAATNAVLTGLTTAAEEQTIFDSLLSNPAHFCR